MVLRVAVVVAVVAVGGLVVAGLVVAGLVVAGLVVAGLVVGGLVVVGSGSLEAADTCTFVAVPSMTSQMEFDSPHRAFPYTVDSLPTWLTLLVPAIGAIHPLKARLSLNM